MKRRGAVLVTVGLLAVLAQTTLFANLRLNGIAANFVLVVTVAVALHDGAEVGATFGFGAGLALDMFLGPPAGLTALAFAVTGYTIGVLRAQLLHASWWQNPVVGALGSLLGISMYVGEAGLLGEDSLARLETVRIIVIGAVLDALVATVLLPIVGRILRLEHHARARRLGALR